MSSAAARVALLLREAGGVTVPPEEAATCASESFVVAWTHANARDPPYAFFSASRKGNTEYDVMHVLVVRAAEGPAIQHYAWYVRRDAQSARRPDAALLQRIGHAVEVAKPGKATAGVSALPAVFEGQDFMTRDVFARAGVSPHDWYAPLKDSVRAAMRKRLRAALAAMRADAEANGVPYGVVSMPADAWRVETLLPATYRDYAALQLTRALRMFA